MRRSVVLACCVCPLFVAPRIELEGSRWPQDGPKSFQDLPKRASRTSNMISRDPQGGTWSASRPSKSRKDQHCPTSWASKPSQETTRGPQQGPKTPPESSTKGFP
eukprot:8043680-Pyramimonas_sp.AAC.1